MREYFYYKCIRKSIVEFLRIFKDIRIAKYNSDGSIREYIDVPIKLGPKEKFYSWMYNRTFEKRLPMMSAEVTSIMHSPERISGKHEKNFISRDGTDYSFYLNPVPYNIDFELKIGTEYINEADQIAEQILPYFNPFVYTNIYVPEIDQGFNLKVMFTGLTLDNPVEYGNDELRRIIWSMSFTAYSWLLQPKSESGEVRKIIQKLYTTDESWTYWDTASESASGEGHDAEELYLKGSLEDDTEIIKYEIWD